MDFFLHLASQFVAHALQKRRIHECTTTSVKTGKFDFVKLV